MRCQVNNFGELKLAVIDSLSAIREGKTGSASIKTSAADFNLKREVEILLQQNSIGENFFVSSFDSAGGKGCRLQEITIRKPSAVVA